MGPDQDCASTSDSHAGDARRATSHALNTEAAGGCSLELHLAEPSSPPPPCLGLALPPLAPPSHHPLCPVAAAPMPSSATSPLPLPSAGVQHHRCPHHQPRRPYDVPLRAKGTSRSAPSPPATFVGRARPPPPAPAAAGKRRSVLRSSPREPPRRRDRRSGARIDQAGFVSGHLLINKVHLFLKKNCAT